MSQSHEPLRPLALLPSAGALLSDCRCPHGRSDGSTFLNFFSKTCPAPKTPAFQGHARKNPSDQLGLDRVRPPELWLHAFHALASRSGSHTCPGSGCGASITQTVGVETAEGLLQSPSITGRKQRPGAGGI